MQQGAAHQSQKLINDLFKLKKTFFDVKIYFRYFAFSYYIRKYHLILPSLSV